MSNNRNNYLVIDSIILFLLFVYQCGEYIISIVLKMEHKKNQHSSISLAKISSRKQIIKNAPILGLDGPKKNRNAYPTQIPMNSYNKNTVLAPLTKHNINSVSQHLQGTKQNKLIPLSQMDSNGLQISKPITISADKSDLQIDSIWHNYPKIDFDEGTCQLLKTLSHFHSKMSNLSSELSQINIKSKQ